MPIVRYKAKHDFHGDSAASQLSFSKGDIILYETTQQPKEWVWCATAKDSKNGWCPLSYLGPEGPFAPRPPKLGQAPRQAKAERKSKDIDEGFGGSIMGGNSPSPETPFAVAEPVVEPVPNRWSQIGSNIQTAGRNSWTAVSNGAQVAGAAVSNGVQRAGQAMAGPQPDNQQPQQEQQRRPSWMNAGNKPRAQRTEGEQRAVNVGNYAARGAVVEGARNVIFNPSLSGLARGVKYGAVTGGAYGFVKDWRPFG